MTSCGFLKAKWNRDREAKRAGRHGGRVLFPYPRDPASRHYVPSKLAERLLKRSPLETTDYEQFRCLDQVAAGLVLGLALGGNVQRRAVSDIPATRVLKGAEKLEFSLNSYLHIAYVAGGWEWNTGKLYFQRDAPSIKQDAPYGYFNIRGPIREKPPTHYPICALPTLLVNCRN